jgi:anhydro-N-acetylmuramic acid kinase
MSGTSLDGVDVVAIKFEPHLETIACASYPMPNDLKALILDLCSSSHDEIEKLGHLDIALAQLFASCCNQLIQDNSHSLSLKNIKAIGLHGQTIRHRPDNQTLHNFTLQIGDPNTVAEQTHILTVADFRRRDVAAGGQGAPLVPAFHHAIFRSDINKRVIVNIGGMANITLLDNDKNKPLIGFDTGPGNVLLDAWINKHQQLSFDKCGNWASQGNINNALLEQLLSLNYFQQDIPKSTGREQFNLQWLESCLALLAEQPSAVDIQRTLLEFTATTISDEISKYNYHTGEVYLCGGGAHNKLLKQCINNKLDQALCVSTTKRLGMHPDWVEASAFAWLAKQTLAGLSGNSATVTGASGERILGAIFQA